MLSLTASLPVHVWLHLFMRILQFCLGLSKPAFWDMLRSHPSAGQLKGGVQNLKIGHQGTKYVGEDWAAVESLAAQNLECVHGT